MKEVGGGGGRRDREKDLEQIRYSKRQMGMSERKMKYIRGKCEREKVKGKANKRLRNTENI
jgi:hypothetical protein